jgi:uncharacterized protein (UPF0147 family)
LSSNKDKENAEKMKIAIDYLKVVSENNLTPRNIRRTVKDGINMLNDEELSQGVRAANVISMLDEITQDPNIPSFSRVTVWSAVSNLESIRD